MSPKYTIAAVATAVLAAAAALFVVVNRSRTELPPVAPAPPRVEDI